LRHYGNRFFHPRLDRRLGLQLLCYARRGEAPAIASPEEQAKRLEPLARFLKLEGWSVKPLASVGGVVVPLVAASPLGGPQAFVGTYPCLVSGAEGQKRHYLREGNANAILLPDYLVEQDLPSAYQEFLRQEAPNSAGGGAGRTGR